MPPAAQFFPDAASLKSDKGVDLEVFQCSNCGLVQLSSDPVSYYKEVVRSVSFSKEMKALRKKQFDNFVKKFSLEGKKVIEIGCGRGEYLSIIQQSGLEAYGLEAGEESVKHCIKNGLKVSQGFIQNSTDKLSHASFDAFFILNFLEHLPDPNSTLKGIYNNLAEGAVGLVEVPNFDMILRKKLFSEFIPDHLFYFTKDSLTAALSLNGFEIIECNEICHEYIISATVHPARSNLPEATGVFSKGQPTSVGLKKMKILDMASFYKHQEKIKREIEGYLGRFKNIAIWGAGHQALAIISLMNLAGKIKYVVDSATFKQNKFTPATHIRIVSPKTLSKDPVDAVMVIAGSYCDEVAGIIKQEFGRNMDIAILRDFGLEEA